MGDWRKLPNNNIQWLFFSTRYTSWAYSKVVPVNKCHPVYHVNDEGSEGISHILEPNDNFAMLLNINDK